MLLHFICFLLGAPLAASTPREPVSIIVVQDESTATQILDQLRAGADFAALARSKSTNPTAKDGGYLGLISPVDLLPELRVAVMPLAAGQLSAVVRLKDGFAVLKVLQQAPAGVGPAVSTSGETPAARSDPAERGQAQAGSATRGTFAAVLDGEQRPITRGGFVKNGPIVFKDIAQQAGLATWTHKMGTPEKNYILGTTGSGVALLDYDNDGWLDIYLVSGSTFDAENGVAAAPKAALFHNNHDGTFTNVTHKAGVANERWGFGVAVGDYDNDGWPDLYVANYGKNRLYHNNRDGTFTDVAEKAGVTLGNWSTGASFGDYDGDGKLDLFVPGYIHWDSNHLPPKPGDLVNGVRSASFGEYRLCAGRAASRASPIISFITTETAPLPT